MIIIVGLGAVGSHVLYGLRNQKRIRVIDFDRVQSKNVLAQFHPRTVTGKNKAVAARLSMHGIFGGVYVDAIPSKLAADNIDKLFEDATLVIDAVDNAATRLLMQTHVRAHNTPCLHIGTSADAVLARIVWDAIFVPDVEIEGAPTCEDGERLPFFQMVGAHAALNAQWFLRTGERRSFMISEHAMVRI